MILLSHMNWIPSDRDQGTCANCWSWAGTGILEIALHSQLGIRDRLSAQYVNSNYSGGHAVLCVGYNDRDPNNRYCIMLNSWKTTPSRPDDLFMVSMDMNYSCIYSGLGYAYYWMILKADFEEPQQTDPAAKEKSGDLRVEAEKRIEEAREQLDRG